MSLCGVFLVRNFRRNTEYAVLSIILNWMCFMFCNFSVCCLIHVGHIVMMICTWNPTVVRKSAHLVMMRVVIICVIRRAKKFVWSVGKISPVVVLKVFKFNLYSNVKGKSSLQFFLRVNLFFFNSLYWFCTVLDYEFIEF